MNALRIAFIPLDVNNKYINSAHSWLLNARLTSSIYKEAVCELNRCASYYDINLIEARFSYTSFGSRYNSRDAQYLFSLFLNTYHYNDVFVRMLILHRNGYARLLRKYNP